MLRSQLFHWKPTNPSTLRYHKVMLDWMTSLLGEVYQRNVLILIHNKSDFIRKLFILQIIFYMYYHYYYYHHYIIIILISFSYSAFYNWVVLPEFAQGSHVLEENSLAFWLLIEADFHTITKNLHLENYYSRSLLILSILDHCYSPFRIFCSPCCFWILASC